MDLIDLNPLVELYTTFRYNMWIFLIAILIYTSIVTTVLFFLTKDYVILLYSGYTLVACSFIFVNTPGIMAAQNMDDCAFSNTYYWFSQLLFYDLYALYSIRFLNLKKHYVSIIDKVNKILMISMIVSVPIAIYSYITCQPVYIEESFIIIFVPLLLILTLYLFFAALKIKSRSKVLFLYGSSFLVIFSIIAFFKYLDEEGKGLLDLWFVPIHSEIFLMLGIFIESIVFSVAFALRVRDIYANELKTKVDLVEKQQEIIELKERQEQRLSLKLEAAKSEIIDVTQRAEKEKLDNLRVRFDNQLTHLKMQSLQSRMNPHFMFNALNSIKLFMLENDVGKSVNYLNKFASLTRSILQSSQYDYITLQEELRIVELYISIENLRFDEAIEVHINRAPDVPYLNIMIPPLLLQPLVENAIWHGLMHKKGRKVLEINIFQRSGDTIVDVTDNGIGREASKKYKRNDDGQKKSIGISMTKDRLKQFNKIFNSKLYLRYIDHDEGEEYGTTAELVIPPTSEHQKRVQYEHV